MPGLFVQDPRHKAAHPPVQIPPTNSAHLRLAQAILILALSLTFTSNASANSHQNQQPHQAPAPVITDNPGDTQSPPWSTTNEPKQQQVTAYTLPPDKFAKARSLSRIGYIEQFFLPLYEILLLVLFVRWRWSQKIRDLAERATSNRRRGTQALTYAALLLLLLELFLLPVEISSHIISRTYGISIQAWPSWFADRAKTQLIATIAGAFLIWGFFGVVRKSPTRWWFRFWLASLPLTVFFVFITPYVIDPMFNKFEPLAAHDAPLADSLERVVARAGLVIPQDRMYWMKASEKLTVLNAYVTGLGASKRVVVWDTTIAKMTRPQIDYVFGHEMGHYVLDHIWKGLALAAAFSLLLFYLVFRMSTWLLRARSARWGIRSPDDWAATPIYLACILLLLFLATPFTNAVSRHLEHQADQYGLEVTHGLTPNSGQVAAQSFQILGEVDMEDPAPNRFEILWYWDHPWIADRIQFALHYDPWSKGKSGEFVK